MQRKLSHYIETTGQTDTIFLIVKYLKSNKGFKRFEA